MGEGENTQNTIVMYEERRAVKCHDGHRWDREANEYDKGKALVGGM